MPVIQVQLMEGRSPEQLRAMVERLTDAMVETANAPRDGVHVIIEEVDPDHWAVGGRLVRAIRAEAQAADGAGT